MMTHLPATNKDQGSFLGQDDFGGASRQFIHAANKQRTRRSLKFRMHVSSRPVALYIVMCPTPGPEQKLMRRRSGSSGP